MSDVLATLAQALTTFAVWLDSVSPIPWPLALAILFPPMVVAFRIWVWLMRGMFWPTTCAYVTTKKGFCRRLVPGEWHRCWQHRRSWIRRTDRHTVDPRINRWELRGRQGVRLRGIGFLSNRQNADTILFQRRGFARRPVAMLRYLRREWPKEWSQRTQNLAANVRELRFRTVASEVAFQEGGVSKRARTAADVMRTILPLLMAGLSFTGLSIPLGEGAREAVQYLATACFVAVWGFARYGLWQGLDDWRASAHRQTLLWFGGFMTAALIAGLLSKVELSPDAPTAARPIVGMTGGIHERLDDRVVLSFGPGAVARAPEAPLPERAFAGRPPDWGGGGRRLGAA